MSKDQSELQLKVFYDPQTGEVVGWVDGYVDNERADGFNMERGGSQMASALISRKNELSQKILNPSHLLSGSDVKYDFGQQALRELDDKEKSDRKAKKEATEKANKEWLAANPPRDPLAEIDALKSDLAVDGVLTAASL